MQLGYVIVYVADVKATVAFYKKAFNLKCRFFHDAGDYAEMDTGSTSLAFASDKLLKTNGIKARRNILKETPAGVEIALVTKNTATAYKKALKAGAKACSKPTKKPWGQTVAYVRDNNGFLVEICTPAVS